MQGEVLHTANFKEQTVDKVNYETHQNQRVKPPLVQVKKEEQHSIIQIEDRQYQSHLLTDEILEDEQKTAQDQQKQREKDEEILEKSRQQIEEFNSFQKQKQSIFSKERTEQSHRSKSKSKSRSRLKSYQEILNEEKQSQNLLSVKVQQDISQQSMQDQH